MQVLDQATQIEQANTAIAKIHGKKATMLIQNSMGCIVLRHITIHEKTMVKPNEKNKLYPVPTLLLYYAMKGKRTAYGVSITENPIAIAEGWQTLPNMVEDGVKGQFGLREWDCFDSVTYQSLKAQLTSIVYDHPGE